MNDAIQKGKLERATVLFEQSENVVHQRTDRLFAGLMVLQWLGGIAAALWISPRTWIGATSYINLHVWAAIFLGGVIASLPVYLVWRQPGSVLTRHTIAIAQMFFSALLIHLTGGRIETHFHVFGSLAILAFYRDWKILVSATVVVALDHLVRGLFWPQSVFGVLTASHWRWLEHAGWVLFEDTFLIISIRQSLNEMRGLAERQASLESTNASIEQKVAERTAELTNEISERRKVETALRESEAGYYSLVDQMPAGIFRKDKEGRYIFVNSWFCRFRGTKPEDYLGKLPQEVAATAKRGPNGQHGDAPGMFTAGTEHHASILQNGQSIEIEEKYCLPDGKAVYHHVVKSPVFGPDGAVTGSQGILLDITQRKHAEEALNYERNLLRALMDKAEDCIYFKDSASRFIRSSASLARLFGLQNPEELVGKQDSDFFGDEHAKEAFEDEQTIMRTGKPMIGKVEKETWPDGRITWALSSKIPFRNLQGEIVGTFGISKDITDIKATEAKLAQMHKQLLEASRQAGMSEVATSVLHNVGNVLNSVNVSCLLVTDKTRNLKVANVGRAVALIRAHENDLNNFFTNDSKGKQLPDYLSKLAEYLEQEREAMLQELGSLVNNVQHIKEIVAMQQNYAKTSGVLESFKMTDLVEDALRMNDGAMSRHHVKVVRDFAEVPPVLTEKHRVLQILVNLIRNAKYACDDSGRDDKQIRLRVANGDGRVKISVIDNGVGIPPENLTRIFGHGFTTRKEGHGFGLHSGALAAKELGGTLTAFSDGPGRGATFTLELPGKLPRENL